MDPRGGGHHPPNPPEGRHGDHHPPHGAHGGAGRVHGHPHHPIHHHPQAVGGGGGAPPANMMLPRLVGGLRCMDVMREMEEQLLILTGGRDRRGAPILSFPQNPRRERAKPEDYKRLLDYLLGVPW